MTPSTSISKTDGNLGVSSATERILAIVAPASAGAYDTPTSFTSKNDLTSAHTSGPLVEAIAYMIAQGIPCVGCRSNPTTAGGYGTVNVAAVTGTSVVTAGAGVPDNDYDVIVEVLTGGTRGVAGIIFRYSLDNGVNWSADQALGTATTATCARGVSFAIAAGTLVTGDKWTVATTGPKNLSADLTDSLAALKDTYSGEWLRVLVFADGDATMIAQCETWAKSFHVDGKYPEMIMCTRPRTWASESRATYQAAMAVIAAAVQTTETSVCVDQEEMVSEVNGWRLRVPQSVSYAARLMIIDDSQDASAKADGSLASVFLETAYGDAKYHDERRWPGLDILGFTTKRTWGGRPITPGVYVNNPRLLSGAGSDYRYFQHSAIVNRIIEMTFQLCNNRLSRSILVDTTTGRIKESIAKSFEDAISADLRTAFQAPGRVSGVQFVLSRTDNVLVTDTLHFDVWIVPLAYPKKLVGKSGLVRVLPQ